MSSGQTLDAEWATDQLCRCSGRADVDAVRLVLAAVGRHDPIVPAQCVERAGRHYVITALGRQVLAEEGPA